ncbi:MAG: POTRA domain-containing protein [Acidobacteriota bacterium]
MRPLGGCIALVVLAVVPAHAQNVGTLEPGAVQQQSNQTERYYGQQKAIQQNKNPLRSGETVINKANPAAARPRSAAGPSFLLKKIETNPSAILAPADISKIAAPYEGKKTNISELHQIVAQINALYRQKGYLTARAFLLPQNVEGGVVHIELVEGRLARISVTGNQHTAASYYTSRVGLKPGDLIRTGPLEKKLLLLNQTSDTQLRAVLQAGSKFGTTDVDLEAREPANISTKISFDNSGYDFIGRNRLGLITTDRSLFRHRDALTVREYWADGTVTGIAQYQAPVGTRGAHLGASVSYNHIDIRSGSLAKLAVRGHFWDYSLNFTQPAFVTRHTLLELYAAPHYQRSLIQSRTFTISRAWATYLELGGLLRHYGSHGLLEWNNSLAGGRDRVVRDRGFLKYTGAFTRAQTLGHGFVAVVRALGQARVAGVAGLAPSQQFQLGGISTVRGYPEGMLIGDNGYALSAELDTPVPLVERTFHGHSLSNRFKLAFFLDHGGILQSHHDSFLTGTGGGVIVNLSRYLTARFNLAGPLQNEANISHLAFEFYLQSTPPWARLIHKH